ncbi:MAG: hypothetical protein NDF55_09970 [archaeon GB-1867-005]|nr:hypothetical protein [Candidatus Culexmicrobium cathedralense]
MIKGKAIDFLKKISNERREIEQHLKESLEYAEKIKEIIENYPDFCNHIRRPSKPKGLCLDEIKQCKNELQEIYIELIATAVLNSLNMDFITKSSLIGIVQPIAEEIHEGVLSFKNLIMPKEFGIALSEAISSYDPNVVRSVIKSLYTEDLENIMKINDVISKVKKNAITFYGKDHAKEIEELLLNLLKHYVRKIFDKEVTVKIMLDEIKELQELIHEAYVMTTNCNAISIPRTNVLKNYMIRAFATTICDYLNKLIKTCHQLQELPKQSKCTKWKENIEKTLKNIKLLISEIEDEKYSKLFKIQKIINKLDISNNIKNNIASLIQKMLQKNGHLNEKLWLELDEKLNNIFRGTINDEQQILLNVIFSMLTDEKREMTIIEIIEHATKKVANKDKMLKALYELCEKGLVECFVRV